MDKHTPGPWNVNSTLGTHAIIGHAGVGAYICDLVGDADTLENARLIAAAPDLLAALRKISLTTEPEYLLEVADHIRGHCESCDSYADNLTELQQTQRVARATASTAIAKTAGVSVVGSGPHSRTTPKGGKNTMTTERAGQTADAYPCRWGCGSVFHKSRSTKAFGHDGRDNHEITAHGDLFTDTQTGVLAAEADRFRAERDALRTALAGLVEAFYVSPSRRQCRVCGWVNAHFKKCPSVLAITAAEAALKGSPSDT